MADMPASAKTANGSTMYAKPDSNTMTTRIARAEDAMDAALKSLSYRLTETEDSRMDPTRPNGAAPAALNGTRNDNAPVPAPEAEAAPASIQRVPDAIA